MSHYTISARIFRTISPQCILYYSPAILSSKTPLYIDWEGIFVQIILLLLCASGDEFIILPTRSLLLSPLGYYKPCSWSEFQAIPPDMTRYYSPDFLPQKYSREWGFLTFSGTADTSRFRWQSLQLTKGCLPRYCLG